MLKRWLLSLLLLLPWRLQAQEESFSFIGISSASTELKGSQTTQQLSTLSLHYGAQTQEWRTLFAYEFHSNSYKKASMQIDKIVKDSLFGTPKVRPYLGVNLSILTYEDEHIEDTHGYSYGGDGGLLFYLSDTIDLDLGYHYEAIEGIESMESLQGFWLSLHYFY